MAINKEERELNEMWKLRTNKERRRNRRRNDDPSVRREQTRPVYAPVRQYGYRRV